MWRKNIKLNDVKKYRATDQDGEQTNLTLCKSYVDYLRNEEYIRLKLIRSL